MNLSNQTKIGLLILFILAIRLISLAFYPLMDTTEARYGEIARIMLETNNWITPQIDYNIPFWGKPPLYAWLSALSIKFLGVSEFALRLPHYLAGLLVLCLSACFAYRNKIKLLFVIGILSTSLIFIESAGAVMTDMSLTLGMTLAMIGFYFCMTTQDAYTKIWAYLGFIGLAMGLLAKGPLTLVLVGLAIVPWLFIEYGFKNALKILWQKVPLFSGLALMFALVLPWYILAEQKTPGFLDYFIIGEHIKRFLVSGWQGDLYGSAHNRPLGTIWAFWIFVTLPWSFVLPFLFWKKRRDVKTSLKQNSLASFCLCWCMSPLILFTFAANILPTYVLPSIPAFAILLALFISEQDYTWFSRILVGVSVVLVLAFCVIQTGITEKVSDKNIFIHVTEDVPVFYYQSRPFSGQFYSNGQAKKIESLEEVNAIDKFYLVGKDNAFEKLLADERYLCTRTYEASSGRTLFYCQQKEVQ